MNKLVIEMQLEDVKTPDITKKFFEIMPICLQSFESFSFHSEQLGHGILMSLEIEMSELFEADNDYIALMQFTEHFRKNAKNVKIVLADSDNIY